MSKPFMFIQAPVQTRSGYGAHARDLVKSLIKMDKFDIKILGLRWGDCPMDALDENNPEDKEMIDRLYVGQFQLKLDKRFLVSELLFEPKPAVMVRSYS